MAGKDIRHSQHFAGFNHGAGVQGKALGVVGIVAGRGAIKGVTVEVGRVVDKIEFQPTLRARFDDRAKTVLVGKRDGDAGENGCRLRKFGLLIARKKDADIVSERGQGLGQGANNVG